MPAIPLAPVAAAAAAVAAAGLGSLLAGSFVVALAERMYSPEHRRDYRNNKGGRDRE
ncbi:MAG: hypothetical protein Q9210_006819 [Variospora velana]